MKKREVVWYALFGAGWVFNISGWIGRWPWAHVVALVLFFAALGMSTASIVRSHRENKPYRDAEKLARAVRKELQRAGRAGQN